MRTNYVPAIIMLLAGLIDSIISIYYKLDLFSFSKRLLLVLVIFYILGYIIKIILDINFPTKENVKDEQGEAISGDESQNDSDDTDNVENIDTDDESEGNNTEE